MDQLIHWLIDWWVCLFVILRFCHRPLFSCSPTERSLKAVSKCQMRTRVSNQDFVARNYAELCENAWNWVELRWIALNCAELRETKGIACVGNPNSDPVTFLNFYEKKTNHKNKTTCLQKVFVYKLCCFVF